MASGLPVSGGAVARQHRRSAHRSYQACFVCIGETGMRKWFAVVGLLMLALGVESCAALVVGSVVGSLDVAGYEYEKAAAPTATAEESQPSAHPKLSLNDIE